MAPLRSRVNLTKVTPKLQADETLMPKKRKPGYDDLSIILPRYRARSDGDFDLDAFASDDLPRRAPDKTAAAALLSKRVHHLAKLQERLYADATWSLLVVFQGMDAAGKDSTIKHVLSGINPQGIKVTSFKAPGPSELAHDFLWRIHAAMPTRGMIGVFNRSHYEDVLIARVHKEVLDAAHLPSALQRKSIWRERIADIAAFEAYLGRQGTQILKIFLNVGRDEQRARLLARLDHKDKTWKFDPHDIEERALWPRYREAYQAAIAGTATPAAPWYVVPADRKWYARLLVVEAMIDALERMDLAAAPPVSLDAAAIAAARSTLAQN